MLAAGSTAATSILVKPLLQPSTESQVSASKDNNVRDLGLVGPIPPNGSRRNRASFIMVKTFPSVRLEEIEFLHNPHKYAVVIYGEPQRS